MLKPILIYKEDFNDSEWRNLCGKFGVPFESAFISCVVNNMTIRHSV